MRHVAETDDLPKNLSAAAHLIHGSSEERFTITYCPGKLTRREIESVGYQYAELETMLRRYSPTVLCDGWNVLARRRADLLRQQPCTRPLGPQVPLSRLTNEVPHGRLSLHESSDKMASPKKWPLQGLAEPLRHLHRGDAQSQSAEYAL